MKSITTLHASESLRFFLMVVATVAVLGMQSAQALASEAMTVEFTTGQTRPLSVALLPPRATLVKQKMVTNEQQTAEGDALAEALAIHIVEYLKEKGYAPQLLTAEQINADKKLQTMVFHVNRQYDTQLQHMRSEGSFFGPTEVPDLSDVEYRLYKVGEQARVLAAALGVDGLIFARFSATTTGFGGRGFARLHISVVGGSTGDIEAHFFYTPLWVPSLKPKNFNKTAENLVTKALKDYPPASATVAEKRTGGGAKSDEAVITEVEALLKSPPSKSAEAATRNTLRPSYKIGIFPFESDSSCVGQVSRPADEKFAAQLGALIARNTSMKLAYSYYDSSLNYPPIKNRGRLWKGSKPNLAQVVSAGETYGLDAIVMYWRPAAGIGYCTSRMPPFPVDIWVIDVKQRKAHKLNGREANINALAEQALSKFLEGR